MSLQAVWQREINTQRRVVDFFQAYLWYTYLWDWSDGERTCPIEEGILREYLNSKWYPDTLITKALLKLNKAVLDSTKSLYDINKEVYGYLRYGVNVKQEAGDNTETVWLIDWNDIDSNNFAIAEEVTVRWKQNTKRPDIVIYVNGIALWIIELKRSKIGMTQWIRQNLDNETENFIKNFFWTMQLCIAWNDTQWLKYGTIGTPEKYYLSWKEDSDIDNILDRAISQICSKERLLELIHNFVVFDKWVKKVCRHNQYFWMKAAEESLSHREGGIIWHTQWSGKSLTMVWLSKWILENLTDSRILIITDREELDEQIEKVFVWVDENIYRTKNGRDLISQLNIKEQKLICSLVHKFGSKKQTDMDGYLDELKKSIPKDFEAKGDIYVFVDECHRTQSWKLHDAMKLILPNAIFVWFTGTPLLKKDKQKSIEIFWKYIHTYKFDEAVKDKVVLDLRYQARDIDQKISSQDKIDIWFESKTKWLTDFAVVQLKKKWGTLQTVLSSKDRLETIVSDILFDFELKPRLSEGTGNALLVAWSIYEACRYYELFQSKGFKKCAVISSYDANIGNIKWESTGEDERPDEVEKYEIYKKMLNGQDAEDFTKEAKKKFIDEPWQMKLLIVVDKLLTGFDAPSATYLYIDKSMRDHGLFQAITRVNRLDGESKEYGYIIDYKDLFWKVEWALWDYTSWAFDDFEADDVQWLLTDRLEKAKERLDEALETIKALCEWVWPSRSTIDYMHYFCWKDADAESLKAKEEIRHSLYKHTVSLIRAYSNIANEMEDAWYSEGQAQKMKSEVKYYSDLREEIKLASGDYIDLKAYEPAMRHLIDSYISSSDSKVISSFEDTTLLELIMAGWDKLIKALPESLKWNKEAVAETIDNNVRKLIIDEREVNPKYYDKMSRLLDEIIRQRKENALKYEEYLSDIADITRELKNYGITPDDSVPSDINTPALKSLYDNLDGDEHVALLINKVVLETRQEWFRGNRIRERIIKGAIIEALDKEGIEGIDIESLFEIIKNQSEY